MKIFHYRKRCTEDKIKEATYKLLAEKGFKELTMRDIAKKAGTALGQLTYYYKKKDNLICYVVDELLEAYNDELKIKLDSSENKIEAFIKFNEEIYKEDPAAAKIIINLITESIYDNSLKEKVSNFFVKTVGQMEDVYKGMKIETSEANGKANFLVSAVYGMMANRLLTASNDTKKWTVYSQILNNI